MASARPSSTHSSNTAPQADSVIQNRIQQRNLPDIRQTHDKRLSLQPQPPSSRNEVNIPRRSAFGFFGKGNAKDSEIDEHEQLKRCKAENKVLQQKLREMEIKANQIGAENEKFKAAQMGDRKINNQFHPDSYYSSALERLSVGITDWTVTHFRGKTNKEYTTEMVDEIRAGLKKLSDVNNHIPATLHWSDVELQTVLKDSKFRIAFVLHVIGLHLHEKSFSPFSYEIEDFGLGYWLKRISDEVARSGYPFTIPADDIATTDVYFKWEWSKTLFKAVPEMFDGAAVESRILRHLKRILRPVLPKDLPDDTVFEKLKDYIGDAIEIAISMRLEQARFVSTFPIAGATFQPLRHSTGGEDQTGLIRMCTFPGVVKQSAFLGPAAPTDLTIFKARVHLESNFQYLGLDPEENENGTAETASRSEL